MWLLFSSLAKKRHQRPIPCDPIRNANLQRVEIVQVGQRLVADFLDSVEAQVSAVSGKETVITRLPW